MIIFLTQDEALLAANAVTDDTSIYKFISDLSLSCEKNPDIDMVEPMCIAAYHNKEYNSTIVEQKPVIPTNNLTDDYGNLLPIDTSMSISVSLTINSFLQTISSARSMGFTVYYMITDKRAFITSKDDTTFIISHL